jgi:hypothetical protein
MILNTFYIYLTMNRRESREMRRFRLDPAQSNKFVTSVMKKGLPGGAGQALLRNP